MYFQVKNTLKSTRYYKTKQAWNPMEIYVIAVILRLGFKSFTLFLYLTNIVTCQKLLIIANAFPSFGHLYPILFLK
jgi:hypothetical protein